ncbi:DUF4397 domain-containing protein [Subtercola lobariae]|uniref:DUF4397 domain-containing protein n=1 Tax=Subtercola lobariae TaxID=1588641 RepID=A0A917B564_9MICO|nr:DUF4397 domain-containing protein [Subtercola lobariae]GGF19502.1 hypothetical protein GCM10011399_11410 [Subtercola lobariae]
MHTRNVLAPAVALAALIGLLFAAPASALASAARTSGSTTTASAPNAASGTGWVRLAHLSPDTAGVDIQLTALTGGKVVESLTDVVYGQVSNYLALPQGTYVVSMASTGQSMTTPVIQTSINITAGQPITVAAYGKNADVRSVVFTDDLTAPGTGQSRVRVVQASTSIPTVNIATTTGVVVAAGAAEGTATPYANVPAGDWMLELTSASGASGASNSSSASTAEVSLAPGSVSTLFVLDNASGGVTVTAVTDASSVGDLPTGGIQTGGGATGVHVAHAPSGFLTVPSELTAQRAR